VRLRHGLGLGRQPRFLKHGPAPGHLAHRLYSTGMNVCWSVSRRGRKWLPVFLWSVLILHHDFDDQLPVVTRIVQRLERGERRSPVPVVVTSV
jgi:hypothetical protein